MFLWLSYNSKMGFFKKMKQNLTERSDKQVSTYVSVDRKNQIRIEAAHQGKNPSEWIRDLIDAHFEEKAKTANS